MGKAMPATLDVYTPEKGVETLGIIQFVHGMAEHKKRYQETIDFFVTNGYICAISDLRGHGDNIESEDYLGYFGPEKDVGLVEDIHTITLYLKEEFPDLPYYLLGHSMGSLIARAYVKKYDSDLNGLILTGSPSNAAGRSIGQMLIKSNTKKHGDFFRSDQINKLVNGSFSKKFKSEGNSFAWLSSNRKVWEAYNEDPKCGFVFTLNGFDTLLNLVGKVYSTQDWEMSNPDLPIYFLSGGEDPCRINDKKFAQAVDTMKQVGYKNVSSKLYPRMRHEILNEIDKQLVYNNILEILKSW